MQSKATTVREYLASLPEDRRVALEAVRKVILANLDTKGLAEGMSYGMIGYFVPHSVYPAGYHCNPAVPLPYAGLASQKGHMSLYMMGLYVGCEPGKPLTPLAAWFQDAWKKSGKKLDMGKACVRFKKLEDLPLDVVGEAFRRLPAAAYIEFYEKGLAMIGKGPKAAGGGRPAAAKAGERLAEARVGREEREGRFRGLEIRRERRPEGRIERDEGTHRARGAAKKSASGRS